MHSFVKNTLVYSNDLDMKQVGLTLERLGQTRNDADYQLSDPKRLFIRAEFVLERIEHAHKALVLLDEVDSDDTRRAAAIASTKPR
ncbi:MAG: hypothetical protein P4L84_09050 [Isosphaeraceae bacterium]|nr:hypothetical protein [Isosphaeraceae bacterium]